MDTAMNAPATLFRKRFDPRALEADAAAGCAIGRKLAATGSGLNSWINVPLINSTGGPDDIDLRFSCRQKETIYAKQLRGTMSIVEWLRSEGFSVNHARLAILLCQDLLRPHVDMHQSVRMLVQLNEHGLDFRHVFGNCCVALQAGELWGVDGTVCHGAANLAANSERVILILDCSPTKVPVWHSAPWNIPALRILPRQPWNKSARLEQTRRAMDLAREDGSSSAEKEWLLLPYRYEVESHTMYSELIQFCEQMASASKPPEESELWSSRACYWRAHDCVCVSATNLVRSDQESKPLIERPA
jgi:hypothetical protein